MNPAPSKDQVADESVPLQFTPNQSQYAEVSWHLRRHVCLVLALIGFVATLAVIVFNPGNVCSKQQTQTDTVNRWEFAYISEKIAECKLDLNDVSGSALLPWLSVMFFPFVMIQFQFTFATIVKQTKSFEDSSDILAMLVRVLECACVGGYFWLVYYDHTGPYRLRHGVATGILFMCATVLNIILWYRLYRHENKFDQSTGLVLVLVVAQVISVLVFSYAIARHWDADMSVEQEFAVALEYIVALIWFVTIIVDCVLYYQIREPKESPMLGAWAMEVALEYIVLVLFGVVGLYLLVIQFVPVV